MKRALCILTTLTVLACACTALAEGTHKSGINKGFAILINGEAIPTGAGVTSISFAAAAPTGEDLVIELLITPEGYLDARSPASGGIVILPDSTDTDSIAFHNNIRKYGWDLSGGVAQGAEGESNGNAPIVSENEGVTDFINSVGNMALVTITNYTPNGASGKIGEGNYEIDILANPNTNTGQSTSGSAVGASSTGDEYHDPFENLDKLEDITIEGSGSGSNDYFERLPDDTDNRNVIVNFQKQLEGSGVGAATGDSNITLRLGASSSVSISHIGDPDALDNAQNDLSSSESIRQFKNDAKRLAGGGQDGLTAFELTSGAATLTAPNGNTLDMDEGHKFTLVTHPSEGSEHFWIQKSIVEATCVEPGEITASCTCHNITDTWQIPIDPDAHSLDGGTVVTPATCASAGEMLYTCTNEDCKHTETAEIPIDPDAHTLDGGTVITPATCASTGEMLYTCTNEGCEHTETAEIPIDPDAHDMETIRIYYGSCVSKGEIEKKCVYCEHTEIKKTDIAPGRHNPDDGRVTSNSTCASNGIVTYYCKNSGCNHTETSTLPIDPSAHSMDGGTITTPATCHSAGVMTYSCQNGCGYITTSSIPATGAHNMDGGTDTTPATCVSAGVRTFTCTNAGCSYSYTEDIPATGAHNYVDHTCTVCGAPEPAPQT